jgi:hypothetical protein
MSVEAPMVNERASVRQGSIPTGEWPGLRTGVNDAEYRHQGGQHKPARTTDGLHAAVRRTHHHYLPLGQPR